MKIEDLDILKPEPRLLKIGGKDIDVSFIPCGITFDVDRIVQELTMMETAEVLSSNQVLKRAFELSVELCSVFCSRKYPEMDKDWFMDNADVNQVKQFSAAIKDALMKAYAGVESGGAPKNRKAAKKT